MSSNINDPRAPRTGTTVRRTGGTPVRSASGTVKRSSGYGTVRREQTQTGKTAPAARRTFAQTSPAGKTAKTKKKKKITLVAILATILMAIIMGIKGIGSFFQAVNRYFDRFRKTETSTIVTNVLVGAAALLIVMALIALCFTGLRVTYGNILAGFGNSEKALSIADATEKEEGTTKRVNRLRRHAAENMLDDGDYDGALAALALLPADDEKGAALTAEARMKKAEKLYEEGAYADAAQLFDLLTGTQRGFERYSDCLICMAVEAYQRNDESEMHQLLMSADCAEERVRSAIIRVTGDAAEADRLMSEGDFSTAAITRLKSNMQAVLDAQANLPTGKIAAGDRHTVGLKSNGTVVACGDNSYGQCEVGSWTDVKMIAAGANHTVALRNDGTVLACGDNLNNQLNVSGWTDIVMVACSAYDTIGLKSDGTVVSCGMHNYDLTGWHDVTSICGGAYSAGCLYNQGSMRSSHKGAQMGAGKLFSSLSVSGAYSAGVMFDGTLASSFDGAPAWTELVRVTASPTGIFAITNRGEVRSFFFRPSDSVNMTVSGSAVEIASSGTHHVILTSDGRVYSFGDNVSGQCATGNWNLN